MRPGGSIFVRASPRKRIPFQRDSLMNLWAKIKRRLVEKIFKRCSRIIIALEAGTPNVFQSRKRAAERFPFSSRRNWSWKLAVKK